MAISRTTSISTDHGGAEVGFVADTVHLTIASQHGLVTANLTPVQALDLAGALIRHSSDARILALSTQSKDS